MTALSLAIDTPDLAQHYETVSADRQFRHGRELLERLGLSQGQRVLDVGCGTGLLALDLVPHATHRSSAQAALHFAQASSFGNYLGRIPSELRSAAERDILAEFQRLREPQDVPQQGTRIIAVAHEPASH